MAIEKPADLQDVAKEQGIAAMALEMIEDGSGAVCRFVMPGVAEVAVLVPKPVVQRFVQQWLANERGIKEMQAIATKVLREKRNGRLH